MKKKIVITQARQGSSRLPGKIMLKAAGKELLLHFIDRVLAATKVDHLIVATTIESRDDIIVNLVNGYHPHCSIFRGLENDVLDRYYKAACDYINRTGEETDIIRITSDCPLIDPEIIDQAVEAFEIASVDYLATNLEKFTWPHGMEIEIFTFSALQNAWKMAIKPMYREHVTGYIIEHPEEFKLKGFDCEEDLSQYRLTLDYIEDYALIKRLIEILKITRKKVSLRKIINFLNQRPDIKKINAHHMRK